MIHFEEHHRDLRAAMDGLPPGDAFNHECLKLNVFDMTTGPYIDGLAAKVRELGEAHRSKDEGAMYWVRLGHALSEVEEALAALDRASDGP